MTTINYHRKNKHQLEKAQRVKRHRRNILVHNVLPLKVPFGHLNSAHLAIILPLQLIEAFYYARLQTTLKKIITQLILKNQD